MSSYIHQNLKAFGAAKVFCILKTGAKPTDATFRAWTRRFHFTPLHEEAQRRCRRGPIDENGYLFAGAPESPMHYFPNLGIVYGSVRHEGWQALKADKRIRTIHSIPPFRALRTSNSAAAGTAPGGGVLLSWGLQALGVDKLWAQGLTGKGVVIGHLDTGVDGTHPAFQGAIGAFEQFDLLGHPVPGNPKPTDGDGHGTRTAGVIAGREALGRAVGIAKGATLISGAVIEGGDMVARVLAGIDWAIGKNVKILNLSLGLPGFHSDFQPIFQKLRQRGILPVVAAGNDGPNSSDSPGNYPEALSVGASAQDGSVAGISASQRFDRPDDPLIPDLVAPGVDIISSDAGGGFRAETGTSLAAPHISGFAALLWEAKPAATADEIQSAIFASCTLPGPDPPERASRGIPDGPKALAALLGGAAPLTAASGSA